MKFDVFFSICQTEVDGYTPDETTMLKNFFDQVRLADDLGYEVAWLAETHLSCQTQKKTSNAVVPDFKGEIGLNTDVLQMAHQIFNQTKNIHVGSAVRNILCNGGPIAHAESIRTFLKLHSLNPEEQRKLNIGFASGRFDFANEPYGVRPRSPWEKVAWPALKGKILSEAIEIFMRLLKSEVLSSEDIAIRYLSASDFRSEEDWQNVVKAYKKEHPDFNADSSIPVEKVWKFEVLELIPKEVSLENLNLVAGTHAPDLQKFANEFLPVGVFNLSITPSDVIEQTHDMMRKAYHKDGGPWQRWHMPRTALIFLDDTKGLSEEEKNQKAKNKAQSAWENYWKAMQGTIDNEKVERAVSNAIYGSPKQVQKQIQEKYHKDDRLMLWFDFNNHDNEDIKKSMRIFKEEIAPHL